MKKVIKERIDKLVNCFSEEWITNFHALIELFDRVPFVSDLISEFEEKKRLDHRRVEGDFF